MKRGVWRRFVTTKRGLSRGARSPRRRPRGFDHHPALMAPRAGGVAGGGIDVRGLASGLALRACHLHGGLGLPFQDRVLRHRHYVVESRFGIQEVEDRRRRKAPVEPDEKPRLWKRRPQQREQPTQHPDGPHPRGCVAGPQHRRAQILLSLDRTGQGCEQRQITPAAIVPIGVSCWAPSSGSSVGSGSMVTRRARPSDDDAVDDARRQLPATCGSRRLEPRIVGWDAKGPRTPGPAQPACGRSGRQLIA